MGKSTIEMRFDACWGKLAMKNLKGLRYSVVFSFKRTETSKNGVIDRLNEDYLLEWIVRVALILNLVPSGNTLLSGLFGHLDFRWFWLRLFGQIGLSFLYFLFIHQILQYMRAKRHDVVLATHSNIAVFLEEDCEPRVPVEPLRTEVRVTPLVDNLHLFGLEHYSEILKGSLLILRQVPRQLPEFISDKLIILIDELTWHLNHVVDVSSLRYLLSHIETSSPRLVFTPSREVPSSFLNDFRVSEVNVVKIIRHVSITHNWWCFLRRARTLLVEFFDHILNSEFLESWQ